MVELFSNTEQLKGNNHQSESPLFNKHIPGGSVNSSELSELPAPDPQKKPHEVTLLLLVELLHVLVGTHVGSYFNVIG